MECCEKKKKERTPEEKRNLEIRLNKIIGQLNGIKKMIDEDRYCDDVLIQLSAVDKSIRSLAAIMLESHMNSCVVDGIKSGDTEVVKEIVDLFKRFN